MVVIVLETQLVLNNKVGLETKHCIATKQNLIASKQKQIQPDTIHITATRNTYNLSTYVHTLEYV